MKLRETTRFVPAFEVYQSLDKELSDVQVEAGVLVSVFDGETRYLSRKGLHNLALYDNKVGHMIRSGARRALGNTSKGRKLESIAKDCGRKGSQLSIHSPHRPSYVDSVEDLFSGAQLMTEEGSAPISPEKFEDLMTAIWQNSLIHPAMNNGVWHYTPEDINAICQRWPQLCIAGRVGYRPDLDPRFVKRVDQRHDALVGRR